MMRRIFMYSNRIYFYFCRESLFSGWLCQKSGYFLETIFWPPDGSANRLADDGRCQSIAPLVCLIFVNCCRRTENVKMSDSLQKKLQQEVEKFKSIQKGLIPLQI